MQQGWIFLSGGYAKLRRSRKELLTLGVSNAIVLMTLPTIPQRSVCTAGNGYIISTGALRGWKRKNKRYTQIKNVCVVELFTDAFNAMSRCTDNLLKLSDSEVMEIYSKRVDGDLMFEVERL